MPKPSKRDMELFTLTVLLVSSASRIAREELDLLIMRGTDNDHDLETLVRARSGVAGLAAIAEHLKD